MIHVADAWRAAYPAAHAGVLVMRAVGNPASPPALEARKDRLATELRARFAGQDRRALDSDPTLAAYAAYYKRFKKTYHVQAQLESIAFKGKSIPSVGSLVEAMFMAEVKNLLLTAGHDVDRLRLPVTLGVADGSERYTLLRGQEQSTKAGDMLMADRAGVISSIVYGPDQRTRIDGATCHVLFAVYAPEGIEAATVQAHLEDIRDHVLIVSPAAAVEALQVLGA